MKKDRHYYYQELKDNDDLFLNKEWLKEAMQCTLKKHATWSVLEENIDKIINDSKYTKDDFLDFISMQNKLIASDLIALEGIKD